MIKKCKRCGDCCQNMIWETEYPDDEIYSLVKEPLTKKQVEDVIKKDHEKYIKTFGITTKKHISIEWNKKKKLATIETRAGRCKHLRFDKNGKSLCIIHKKRSDTCKDYFCRKARQ